MKRFLCFLLAIILVLAPAYLGLRFYVKRRFESMQVLTVGHSIFASEADKTLPLRSLRSQQAVLITLEDESALENISVTNEAGEEMFLFKNRNSNSRLFPVPLDGDYLLCAPETPSPLSIRYCVFE